MGTIGVESNGRMMYGLAGAGLEIGNCGQDHEILLRERSKRSGMGKRLRCDDQIGLNRVRKHRKRAIESKEKSIRSNGEDSESDSVSKVFTCFDVSFSFRINVNCILHFINHQMIIT